MKRNLLITGASGVVGMGLIEKYLKNSQPNPGVIAISHKKRLPIVDGNVKVINGDVKKRDLGLKKEDKKYILDSITDIIHCAAATEFSISKREGQDNNVAGTKHVLDLASRCKSIKKIALLSTIYVSGKRTGTVYESELEHTTGFVNEYEKSKYDAEILAQSFIPRLPISIYRLSTIIGSEKGYVHKFGAIHHALRLFYNGMIPMVPGYPNSEINLISSECAINSLYSLFENNFKTGRIYHIASQGSNSMSLENFLESSRDSFNLFDPKWKDRMIEVPPIVSLDTFNTLKMSVESTNNVILKNIVDTMNYFVPQLAYPKKFDMTNTKKDLQGSKISQESLQSYLPNIIKYCLESKWGKKMQTIYD